MIKKLKIRPLNNPSGVQPKETYTQKLEQMIKVFKSRVEAEARDYYSYYKDINVPIQNIEQETSAKAGALTLKFQEQGKHLLEISVLHPSMEKEVKRPLKYGNQQEILDFLNNREFLPNIKTAIKEMSEKLYT